MTTITCHGVWAAAAALAMSIFSVASAGAGFPTCVDWEWVGPVPTGTPLMAVASSGDRLAAVSSDGVLLTSAGGELWQRWDDDRQSRFWGVAWGNGRFVAVGWDTIAVGDGYGDWQRQDHGEEGLRHVAWGGGQFLALALRAVLLSADGVTWERVPTYHAAGAVMLAAAWHDGLWVAVGTRGTVWTSTNGRDWQWRRGSPGDPDLRAVVRWQDRWVAVGDQGLVLTSGNGVSWAERRLPGGRSLRGVAGLANRVVAVGQEVAAVSQGGQEWSEFAVGDWYNGVVHHGDTLVAVHDQGVSLSSDGEQWDAVGYALESVAAGPGGFVAVGSGGVALFSPDGRVWQRGQTPVDTELYDVAAGGGRWVAVGEGGVAITSEDGLTWERRESGLAGYLWRIAWGGAGFVVLSWDGAAIRSDDGINWQPSGGHGVPAAGSLIWSRGVYLAANADGIFASADGSAWAARLTYPSDKRAVYLATDGAREMAVRNTVYVTADGDQWDEYPLGEVAVLDGVVWAGDRFVAVRSGYADAAVFSSADGVFWRPEPVPQQYVSNDARVISLAAGAGALVAVGLRNTILAASCGGGEAYVPGVAHNPGYQGTVWRSDLAVFNPSQTRREFTLQLLERGRANLDPEPHSFALDPGLAMRYPDLVRTVFDRATSGTVRISSSPGETPLAVAGRTYNQAAGGTFGQGLGVLDGRAAVPAGRVAILPQLAHSASMESGYRTNIGLVNVSAVELVVEIVAVTGEGVLLGRRQETLQPFEHRQVDNVLAHFTSGDVAAAYATVHTPTPGASFLTYASVVDNRTGDPTLVLPQ